MALLFWDSFDHYATGDLLEKHISTYAPTAPSPTIGAYGRMGSNGIRVHGYVGDQSWVRGPIKGYPDVVTIGVAWEVEDIHPWGRAVIIGLLDGATHQVVLAYEPDASLTVWRGNLSTRLGATDPGIVHPDVLYYVEMQVTIDNAAGAVEVRLNDDVVIDVSGVDTQATSNAQVSAFELGGDCSSAAMVHRYSRYDDLYVVDDSGSYCNDFLGDTRLCALFPEGTGAHADWTPTAGNNWQCVDDNPPNDDTDYNHTLTPTDRDSFEMEDLPAGISGTVHAVCAVLNARKDNAGTRTIQPAVRSGGTDYDGDSVNLPNGYEFRTMYAWETDPDTVAPWLVAAVNAVEAGYELVA